MQELFKPIEETTYEISNFGYLRNNSQYNSAIRCAILLEDRSHSLYVNKKVISVIVRNIIADLFIPNPDNLKYVEYINSQSAELNHISNIRRTNVLSSAAAKLKAKKIYAEEISSIQIRRDIKDYIQTMIHLQ